MTIIEAKKEIDKLVSEGYGDWELMHTQGSYITYFDELCVDEDNQEVIIQ